LAVRCVVKKISPEFEFEDQKSKVKVTIYKKTKTCSVIPLTMQRHTLHAAAYDTTASQPGGDRVTAVHSDGGLPLEAAVLGGRVLGALASASSTPVGKSAHAV